MPTRVLNSNGTYHASVEADLKGRLSDQEIAFALIKEICFDTANGVLTYLQVEDLREVTRAALLRSLSLTETILILARAPFNEEMWCLVRPLVELAVNTAYLQTASKDELRRYLLYDDIKGEELHAQFDWLESQSGLTHPSYGPGTPERELRKVRAENARATGLFEELYRRGQGKLNAWSELDLFARAKRADALGVTASVSLFEILHRSVIKEAHGHIHSNNTSLGAYRSVDELGKPLKDSFRVREAQLIASIANAASFSLVSIVRRQVSLNDHTHSRRVISILRTSFPD